MSSLPRRGRAGCLRRRIEDQAAVIIIKNLGDIGNVAEEPIVTLWLSGCFPLSKTEDFEPGTSVPGSCVPCWDAGAARRDLLTKSFSVAELSCCGYRQ